MKYSLLFSILSLIAWKYDYMTWAGISGLIGGFLYLLAFRKQLQLILIAAIGAGVISIMLFPPEMSPDVLIYIGISWAVSSQSPNP